MKNNRKAWRAVVLCLLLAAGVLLLAACHGGDEAESTATTEGTTSTSGGGPLEEVTAPPRYDYFAADVSRDVTIDKSVYDEMHLTIPASLQITQEKVTAQVNAMRFKNRTPDNDGEKVTDQPLKMGDSAFIYYRGTVDGKEFDGGSNMGEATPHELGLGSGNFIPGFEDGLVGVVPADTSREKPFALHVTFPETYGNAALRGREAVFYVVVEYAVPYTIPEYTRDFVVNTLTYEPRAESYADDAELLAEFEEYIRVQLETKNQENVYYAKVNALWTYLTDSVECRNLPQSEIDFYYDSYISEIEYYYEMYKAYGGEDFANAFADIGAFAVWYKDLDKEGDWKDQLTLMATRMVKKNMISHAVAEAEGLESVTTEQFNAQVNLWVEEYQGYMTAEEIIKNMGEIYFREAAFAEKMEAWLLERADFSFAD